jgi:hypothetical protein
MPVHRVKLLQKMPLAIEEFNTIGGILSQYIGISYDDRM